MANISQNQGMTGSSVNTVVGVYETYDEAQNASQAIVAAGIANAKVQITPKVDEAGVTSTGTSASHSDESSGGIMGFFRSLFGSDESSTDQDIYAESVRRGHYVLAVDADSEDEADRAAEIMSQYNAVDISERASQWKAQGWSGYDDSAPRYTTDQIQQERASYAQTSRGASDKQAIPVIQEELQVGKRQVQRGGIRVIQRVRETPVNESVQLREERVNVERRPVDQPASQADLNAFKEGAIELRETGEEAVVAKSARVVEEVVVGKETTQRTEQIQDTVRRTDVEVEQLGTTGSMGTTSTMSGDDSDFRNHWQTTYGSSGGRYEDYDAAYRYGSSVAGSDRYRDHDWSETEADLRSDWERDHTDSTWDKVKDAVRYGAERATGNRQHRH